MAANLVTSFLLIRTRIPDCHMPPRNLVEENDVFQIQLVGIKYFCFPLSMQQQLGLPGIVLPGDLRYMTKSCCRRFDGSTKQSANISCVVRMHNICAVTKEIQIKKLVAEGCSR